MKLRTALALVLDVILGVALVVWAARVADHASPGQLELGRARMTTLAPATRERLAALRDKVFITYYVSPAVAMPSHLRRLESDVTDLLDALKRGSGGLLDYQVVDPTTEPDLLAYAARRKVSPLRVRHVSRDSYSEREIWSTLTIAYGPRRPARIEGVVAEHLPRLQAILVEQLDQLEAAPRPKFALAAPPGFDRLGEFLAQRGELLRVDIDADEPLPDDADVLFWIDPGVVSPERLVELEELLERGQNVVIAGSRHVAGWDGTKGSETLTISPRSFDADVLWGAFGLSTVDGLVLDVRSAPLVLGENERLEAPFRVACIANNQDFHNLTFEPNGNLLFIAPTPLIPDGEALAARGLRAEVLATTSEFTWMMPMADRHPLAEMTLENGESVPKLPLIVWLRPNDPWRGSVVAMAGSTPFRDELFEAQGVAHPRLARVLVETLAAPDRLVIARADVARPEPLPELSAAARAGWRALCLGGLPVVLALLALVRRRPRVAGDRPQFAPAWGRPLLVGIAAVALFIVVLAAGRGLGLERGRVDLTQDGLNTLHPETAALAAAASGSAALEVELIVSGNDRLPPELRRHVGRLGDILAELQAAGAELSVTTIHPEDLDDAGRQALHARGLSETRAASQDEEVTTVRSIWSTVVLRAGERTEVLSFPDVAAYENLEFRMAFALWRLATGRRPHIAFASDEPRLSAAELHEHYQTQGLISPQGKDEYFLVRQLLRGADFRVTHVQPRDPVMPPDIDLLVWLQPRRPAAAMLGELAEHLYRGGSALLAVQHFNVQTRQYRGTGFEFVHWPRPQNPDVDHFWFPELGIEVVREVLFDSNTFALDVESQITRAARRDFTSMHSALPIQIRALSSYFADDSVVTANLGDQAFLWASYLRWDEARLAELGLRAKTLMTTSNQAWTYLWSGGWIPVEQLAGPPAGGGTGPLPLAALFEGRFPWPQQEFGRSAMIVGPDGQPRASEEVGAYPEPEPVGAGADGRLLLLGCSEPFKDVRLTQLRPDYRADHLLLNAVASLALDERLAAVMAHRPVARGFDPPPPETRLRWRAGVLLLAPFLYVLLGLARRLLVRRPTLVVAAG